MITLHLRAGSPVAKLVDEAAERAELYAEGDPWSVVTKKLVALSKEIPPHAAMVLQAGRGAPKVAVERWAARHSAMLACLPEAADYVHGRVARALDSGADLVLLDAGLMNLDPVAGR